MPPALPSSQSCLFRSEQRVVAGTISHFPTAARLGVIVNFGGGLVVSNVAVQVGLVEASTDSTRTTVISIGYR